MSTNNQHSKHNSKQTIVSTIHSLRREKEEEIESIFRNLYIYSMILIFDCALMFFFRNYQTVSMLGLIVLFSISGLLFVKLIKTQQFVQKIDEFYADNMFKRENDK